MATTIWSGLNAGVVRYDLSYDASRPDPYGDTVNITFYLRYYLANSNSYFGYNIVVQNLWCQGSSIVTNHQVKANSPNKFDATATFSTSVSQSSSSVWGIRLIMTSPANISAGGSSGIYDTGTDISISVPAKSSHTAPSAPTTFTVPSSQHHGTAFTISWSGASAGSRPIQNYDLAARAYNGSTWSDWSIIVYPAANATSYNVGAPNTLSYGGYTTATYGTNLKLQYRIRASDGISLTSGWKESGTVSITKNGRLMYKDSNGTWKECTRLKAKDTGGTVRNCSALKVKDTSGSIRTIEIIQ